MNRKYHYLYKVVLKKNKKIYYGIHSTDNLNDRYFAHGTYIASDRNKSDWVKSNHGKNMKNSKIYNAMQKYGPEGFEREIVEMFTSRKDALKKEEEIVTEEFINSKKSLNNRVGGMQGQFSIEVRKKISKNNPMHRKEVRKKVSESQKERWTEDLKEELSKNNPMHNRNSYEKHLGKNSSWFGRKHSSETKKKISETKKGQKITKEQRKKSIESLKRVGSTKFEIIDTTSNKKFTSLSSLKDYLLLTENIKIGISTLSQIINKKKNKETHFLFGRFVYTKNSYADRNPARIFKRGEYWQMRIWINKEKKHFKKSLGTRNKKEALRIAKIEEDQFYKKNGI